ncbi:MAG TPA: PRC-barrel domain-containing protein [Gaiellales bacterium]|nr:PRC-barrel domain-containing protein [Gaiellales bacterium]
MSTVTLWEWREGVIVDNDLGNLVGFGVEATDGSIGKIDQATGDVGASYVVVDTGPWIFGKKVMIPASMIGRVDYDDETVYVNAMKEQIKNAPEFEESTYRDQNYRDQLGTYYSSR